jgi:hypothetical protein
MLDKQSHEPVILTIQKEGATLDLRSNPDDMQIKRILTNLIDGSIKTLTVQVTNEEQAKKFLALLKQQKNVTININLSPELENTKTQIALDHLISNHRLEKNSQKIENYQHQASKPIPLKAEARVLPKGKIKPKIEITLTDDPSAETRSAPVIDLISAAQLKPTSDLPQLERSPMAEQVVTKILSFPSLQAHKAEWEGITNRKAEQQFRQDRIYKIIKENNLFSELIKNNKDLHAAFTKWDKVLNLDKEQYDALLDVYGQYGELGLAQLFKSWDDLDQDKVKGPAFRDTYKFLLKSMPSFIPFIEHKELQDTLTKIGNLGKVQRSWWMALIKNHGKTSGYSDLPCLYKQFMDTVIAIEKMGLDLKEIQTLKDVKDVPSALSDLLTLLNKCHPEDRAIQLECIHTITIPKDNPYHFIIPEMQLGTDLGNKPKNLEEIKGLINNGSDPQLVLPAFYRYLATQEQHLPLDKYKTMLDELISNKELNNDVKIRMIYMLAKTTSTAAKTGFDSGEIIREWNSFKDRMIGIKSSLDRINSNLDGLQRSLVQAGTTNLNSVRIQAIDSLMPMSAPMSYLNKLLKLSEYAFLRSNLNIPKLIALQKEMTPKIEEAAAFYNKYPGIMMEAARLIKTETVKKAKNGQFSPETEDIRLLEKFITSSTILMDPQINTVNPPELNPINILLPLLTTFHLEYEIKDVLNEKGALTNDATIDNLTKNVIAPYKKRLNEPQNAKHLDKIRDLLPYSLSLLQLIQSRDIPNKLDYNTLNKIQDGLMVLICRDKPTTKKEIREWMNQEYGKHFEKDVLLNLKDAVDYGATLTELNCTEQKTRESIEKLVSIFDNAEEKDQHKELVTCLVHLEKTLTPDQKVRFFEFCQEAFKSDGLLSRNKHPGPPSYLAQFKSLVETITQNKSFDEFERYMNMAEEHCLEQGDVSNGLAKCNYLLSTLYPELLKKKISRKEAFNFSAELVCISSFSSLHAYHEKAEVPKLDYPKELNDLRTSLSGVKDSNLTAIKSPEKLKKCKEHIDAIIRLAGDDQQQLKQCRAISARLSVIIKAIDARTTANQTKKNILKRVVTYFKKPPPYTAAATQDELNSLVLLGLVQELTTEKSATYNEIQAIRDKEHRRFHNVVLNLHAQKTELIKKYSNIAMRADDFIGKALTLSPNDISKKHNDVCQLIGNLIAIDHQNLVLSLMYHYAGGLPDRGVKDLIELFNSAEYKDLPQKIQKGFINAIITQMNNSVECSKEDIQQFLTFIHKNKNNELITERLHEYYKHAPFPPLSKFMKWIESARKADQISIEVVEENYRNFDKKPCATDTHNGREEENGFKIGPANVTLKNMPEVRDLFTEQYLSQIGIEQVKARDLSTGEILKQLESYKGNPPKTHIQMVMLAAELLHRCKGRPPIVGQSGRSFELNTTQILSILALLDTGKKVTAEIGTGEGKSRIMMLLNACQFLKGNTVDFLTSNLALAERDYLESLTFFSSLGAEVNFITSTSKIEDYKMGGINVSDPENLCLFRNKAFSQKKSNLVLNPDPTKRALLLDEADVTYFDVAHLKYNYSSETPQKNRDFLPLYPLLMDFFAETNTENTYKTDKQRCNQQLLAFIEARDKSLFELIKTTPSARLEQFQDAAYLARRLEYNVDYTVVSEATTATALGNIKVAAAMCLIGSRASNNANFADGVHQCLHAELNRLTKKQDAEINNPYLREALDQCKKKGRVFTIESERTITQSSSSNTLLKAYEKGSMHAVTGTIGSKKEQQEAQNEFESTFLRVPRHKGLRRFDRPTRIIRNEEKHLDALVEHILESRAKNQPVLLICKNDNESIMLHDKLAKRIKDNTQNGLPKLTRIHAGSDSKEEAKYINKKAGKPGHVTITTEMEGRGVDIHLQDEASKVGLKVLLTYLPHGGRDLGQILGRSGRYGAFGETQMVLNLESLKKDFGIDHLNSDFYYNPEDFIRKLQVFATHTKELHRLFHRAYDNYLSHFSELYEAVQSKDHDLTPAWSEFLKHYNLSKDLTLKAIESEMEKPQPNIEEINKQLDLHNKKAKTLWGEFKEKLPEDKKAIEEGMEKRDLQKPKLLDAWLVEMQGLGNKSKVVVKDVEQVRVQEKYDPTAAGSLQLSEYTGFFSFLSKWFKDIQAKYRGEGSFAPNFGAWREGKISGRNFLSQLPITHYFWKPQEENRTITKEVPSTHAVLYQDEKIVTNNLYTNPKLRPEGKKEMDREIEKLQPPPQPQQTAHPTQWSTEKRSSRQTDNEVDDRNGPVF